MKFNYTADYEALETGLAGDMAQGIGGVIADAVVLQIRLNQQQKVHLVLHLNLLKWQVSAH